MFPPYFLRVISRATLRFSRTGCCDTPLIPPAHFGGRRARCLGTILPWWRSSVLQPPYLPWRLPYFHAVLASTRSRRREFRMPPCSSAVGCSRFAAVLQPARYVTRKG